MKSFTRFWFLLIGLLTTASVYAQDKTGAATMSVDWADSTSAKSMSDVSHAMPPKYVNLRIKKVVDSLAAVQPKKGDTGATGGNGSNGTNGTNGVTPTITIGTVTTLAYGSTPTFTNVGTATSIIWNIAMPVGKDGATGPTGASGLSGPQALTATATQSIPTVAIAATHSFTTACAGAKVGMPVVVAWPSGFLVNLSAYEASVLTDGVITTTFKALVLITSGSRTFFYRVLQ